MSSYLRDTTLDSSTTAHELGHNLGFWHASAVVCTDGQYHVPESLWDPTNSCGTDTFKEYGDADDTMGGGYTHFSTIWKSQAKWIDSSQIQEAVNSEYTIDQVELSSSGTKILQIPLGKDNDGNDFYYWVEYRKNLGTFDKKDIVQIRAKPTSVYTGSELSSNSLRFMKSTGGDYVDIDTDKSFYDPYRGVKIELIEKTGSGSDSKAKLKVVMAPRVTIGSVTNTTSISATLNGTVNAYEETATAWFEYGTTSGSYSNTTSTQTVSGSTDTTVSIDISDLSENTTYYYRIVAQNSSGTMYGNEGTFILITVTPKIAAGREHTIALKSDGTVWTWGSNDSGQSGDGTTTDRNTPVQVSSLSGGTAIAGGGNHTITLKSDGTVWAWGDNRSGQLGDGTTTDSSTPVQVSSLSGVTAIAGGYYHTIALKSDGMVWAWGSNYYGRLGDGTTTQRTTPVQVSGLSGVTAIAGGAGHSIALKSDGTVWAWGDNNSEQLGDGSNTSRSTPVQVSSLGGVTTIAGGFYHTIALKSDGTVWAWGYNGSGQLGDGTTTEKYTPVQVDINLGETPDTFVPTGSININSDSAYTNSTTVTLNLSASDGTGVTGYDLSISSTKPSSDDTGWMSISSTTSFSADVSYTLSSGDGSKTVYVWYKDAAGNVSDTASDSIIMDTTTPNVTITGPTSDSTYTTTNKSISLSGIASDNTSGISSVTWMNSKGKSGQANGTTDWSIRNIKLRKGKNVIIVTAQDNAGNTGSGTITITRRKNR